MTIVALKVKNFKKKHFFAKKCKLRKFLLPLKMKTTVESKLPKILNFSVLWKISAQETFHTIPKLVRKI